MKQNSFFRRLYWLMGFALLFVSTGLPQHESHNTSAALNVPASPSNLGDVKWNTFLGGAGMDEGKSMIITSSGNLVTTGYSDSSWGNPLRPHSGNLDASVSMLDVNGNLKWHTFLGGAGNDGGLAIAITPAGNILVTGYSDASWGTPIRAYSGSSDSFVAMLDSNGILKWHTFLGGASTDEGHAIVITAAGNILVAGNSWGSWGNPLSQYLYSRDAFVAMLDANGSLKWNTFLGGTSRDFISAVTVTSAGNILVAGYSDESWGNPVRPYSGYADGFVAMLDANGNLRWHTFLGGADGSDEIYDMTITLAGNILIAGYSSYSWGNPIRLYSSYGDASVIMLDANGNLKWHTFLGGDGGDFGSAITVNSAGNIFVTGYSSKAWGNPEHPYSGGYDILVAMLDLNGNLKWHTFLGGTGNTSEDQGHAIAVNSANNILVSGSSSALWGNPARPYSGNSDIFVAMLDTSSEISATPSATAQATVARPSPTPITPTSTPLPASTPTATPVPPTATPIPPSPTAPTSAQTTPTPASTNTSYLYIALLANALPGPPPEPATATPIPTPDPCLNQDCREPNNSFTDAKLIQAGEQVLASVNANTDERDIYRIQLQAGKRYMLQLKFTGNSDLDLYLYDAPNRNNDSRVGSSTTKNNAHEQIVFTAQSNNLHYVEVVAQQTNNGRQQYELIVTEQ